MSNADIQKIPGLQPILDKCQADIQELTGKQVSVFFRIKFHYVSTRILAGIVCDVCEVKWSDVTGTSRKGLLVIARHLYCYFSYEYQKKKLKDIAQVLSRDHTTILHSINHIKNMVEVSDDLYLTYYNEIEKRITQYLAS